MFSITYHLRNVLICFFVFVSFSEKENLCRNYCTTAKNNRKAVEKRLADSISATQEYVNAYGSQFPVPVHYAHAGVLRWMIDILAENRAQSIPQALNQLKIDLKKLNANVTVDQEQYDEIMAIKPLFLVRDYE